MRVLVIFLGLFTAFHILFWQQGIGINLPIFIVLFTLAHTFKNKAKKARIHWFILSLVLVSAIAVVLIHSILSIVVLFISALVFVGSLQQQSASAIEGLANSILNFFSLRQGVIPNFQVEGSFGKKRGLIYMRIASIPILILFAYILLFSAGNSIFNSYTGDFLNKLSSVFTHFTFPHVVFVLFGIMVCRLLLRTQWALVVRLKATSILHRTKGKIHRGHQMALKFEYIRAVVLFASLNVLFAFINFIDVKWVWFQFNITNGFNLKAFVHEGTGYLLLSLLLSIGLILFFFRNNLNFYPKSKLLKNLAYVWIVQNIILAISVVVRTGYYINFHGLASKRIALLVFVSMVLFGLLTLMLKIAQQRNFAFILRTNSAYMLGAIVFCACIPWNFTIAKHNLAHHNPHEIDVDNYLKLNPSVYPLLYANLETIEGQIEAHNTNKVKWINTTNITDFKAILDKRTAYYLSEKKEEKVWSWNWADSKAVAWLE